MTRPAVLIDLGGVLVPDYLGAAANYWAGRLGIAPGDFLAAVFAGNDEAVLVGRTSESAWWELVGERLRRDAAAVDEIRRDLAARHRWDAELVDGLRGLRGRVAIAIVSNAWPAARARIVEAGVDRLVDAVVLSCEVGCAKPDRRIYEIALRRLGVEPGDALFVDDTEGHVDAARSLGMAGHLHDGTAGVIERIEIHLRCVG
ncbi:HAD family hydrolase [Paractinoplanes rishiriensis]|uniref:Haloacid dehalogenase n=1 Tax=Paractinoplanes rishiriensis TaxID=1050105 RepID=A0A919K3X7_9ACTN|nr:HAD family phosphatase [Actinoplanes rishiriensis]GIE98118.1 hypothetical protein Ari01nite_55830 [Actinoplanes rishiriensis]